MESLPDFGGQSQCFVWSFYIFSPSLMCLGLSPALCPKNNGFKGNISLKGFQGLLLHYVLSGIPISLCTMADEVPEGRGLSAPPLLHSPECHCSLRSGIWCCIRLNRILPTFCNCPVSILECAGIFRKMMKMYVCALLQVFSPFLQCQLKRMIVNTLSGLQYGSFVLVRLGTG